MKHITFFSTLVLCLTYFNLVSQANWTAPQNPEELGEVHWLRNYDEAVLESKQSGLPVFILFQEVPGCSNCTTYGNKVLSHPFIVEMIETHFVPLAIFNNKGGHDKKVLERFNEPSWNNPVVRVVSQQGQDIISRLSGDFSPLGLASKIKQALPITNQVVPLYFDIWYEELKGASSEEEAYLSMYCFWTGEKEIAQLDGVLSTEAGYMHGKEVVKVTYNKDKTRLKTIVKAAKSKNCADQVYVGSDSDYPEADKTTSKYRIDKEVKYYLLKSPYKSIPMTPLQAAKVNAAIGSRKDPKVFLSDRQIALLDVKSKAKSRINQEFVAAWYEALSDTP